MPTKQPLLHLQESILRNGPLWAYHQYSLEDLLGKLKQKIKIKNFPMKNLAWNLTLQNQVNSIDQIQNNLPSAYHREKQCGMLFESVVDSLSNNDIKLLLDYYRTQDQVDTHYASDYLTCSKQILKFGAYVSQQLQQCGSLYRKNKYSYKRSNHFVLAWMHTQIPNTNEEHMERHYYQ